MSLITCSTCKQEFAKSAKACPHCGERNKHYTSGCAKFALAVVVGFPLLMFFSWINGGLLESDPNQPAIYNSPSGSVYEVTQLLKRTLKDPKSYEPIEWSKVIHDEETGNFYVRHKYRAKNSFGGYVIEEKIFIFDSEGKFVTSTGL